MNGPTPGHQSDGNVGIAVKSNPHYVPAAPGAVDPGHV
jgi:hypothetical protein